MENAKLQVQKAAGKVRLVVRNANAKLRTICDELGIKPAVGISNCREIWVSTPEELDKVREPLRTLFDAAGNYIGG